jgi:fucose permease
MTVSQDEYDQPLLGDPEADSFPQIANAKTLQSQSTLDEFRAWARLISCCISAAAAGWHDGCIGSLIPYLQAYYGGVSDERVSLVFIGSFSGYILASLLNVTLNTKLGLGRLFILSAAMQAAASLIITLRPPFNTIAISYALAGFGLSLQDAQFNTYATRLPNASTKLGIIHAIYGLGAMVSPAAATLLMRANVAPPLFYFTELVWCVATIITLLIGFGLSGPSSSDGQYVFAEESDEGNASLMTVISSRSVWTALPFICLYTGSETAEAGWVVSFLMRTRDGGAKSGYASTAFYGGLTSSRVILLPVTAWLAEKKAIALYAIIALAMQVVIWTLPLFVVDFIAIAACGFVMGPIYPVTLGLVTKTTPRGYHTGAISLLSCFGMAGSASIPFVVGSLADTYGIKVLQPTLVSVFVVMILLWQLVPTPEVRPRERARRVS